MSKYATRANGQGKKNVTGGDAQVNSIFNDAIVGVQKFKGVKNG